LFFPKRISSLSLVWYDTGSDELKWKYVNSAMIPTGVTNIGRPADRNWHLVRLPIAARLNEQLSFLDAA
jgi:hypothetical protein